MTMLDPDDSEMAVRFAGRFVILTHDHPSLHWDLMLEADGVLRTWRLLAEPCPDVIIAVEPLPDHRLHYLDYEGPLSGDRGSVTRWDHGTHTSQQTPEQIVSSLTGQRLGAVRSIINQRQDDCTLLIAPLGAED